MEGGFLTYVFIVLKLVLKLELVNIWYRSVLLELNKKRKSFRKQKQIGQQQQEKVAIKMQSINLHNLLFLINSTVQREREKVL